MRENVSNTTRLTVLFTGLQSHLEKNADEGLDNFEKNRLTQSSVFGLCRVNDTPFACPRVFSSGKLRKNFIRCKTPEKIR